MPVSKHNGRLGNALKERHICLIHSCVANVLQAQPATLASLVGALNLRSLNSNPAARAAVRALGEEECTSSSTPPQLEHARPSWTQSLAQSREASSSGHHSQAPIAVPATVRCSHCSTLAWSQCCWDCCTSILTQCWSCCCLEWPCLNRCIFTIAAVHHACKLIKLAWQLMRYCCNRFSNSRVLLLLISHWHVCPCTDVHMHMTSRP